MKKILLGKGFYVWNDFISISVLVLGIIFCLIGFLELLSSKQETGLLLFIIGILVLNMSYLRNIEISLQKIKEELN